MQVIQAAQFCGPEVVVPVEVLDLVTGPGKIRRVIGQTFPLQRAADAHRAIEARAVIGKTLLEV